MKRINAMPFEVSSLYRMISDAVLSCLLSFLSYRDAFMDLRIASFISIFCKSVRKYQPARTQPMKGDIRQL